MKYFIFILFLFGTYSSLFCQTKKDSLLAKEQKLEAEIEILEIELEAKESELKRIKQEIIIADIEELKDGKLKVPVGDREPYFFDKNLKTSGRLQRNEKVTVVGYAVDIDKIKIYSPSLDKVGYVVSLVFKNNEVVKAFIEKEENRFYYKEDSSKKANTSTGKNLTPSYQSTYSSPKTYTPPKKYKSSKRYIRGPRGGCYYINSNGNKTYVDRSLCN